jgi:DNA-binding XRE family transcriptional regulator
MEQSSYPTSDAQAMSEPISPRRKRNRVRELREDRLMTQAQLARKAHVALRTIHSVEKGMNCRMDTKRKILLALGIPFERKHEVFMD